MMSSKGVKHVELLEEEGKKLEGKVNLEIKILFIIGLLFKKQK